MLHRYLQRLRFATKTNMVKKTICVSYCTANDHYSHILNVSSEDDIKQFIIANTDIVRRNNLTPEISLRLFTPNSKFWHAKPELWPFTDPYWAIYWPGGQALARYLLNNPEVARGRKVLDLGCGCGASAIAAEITGAVYVLANDVDPVAAIATKLNCELNGLESLPTETENLIGTEPKGWDLILLGDMFYEEVLIDSLHTWLRSCIQAHGTQVLIGDPGRAHLESHVIRRHLRLLANFQLPESIREENFGLSNSCVWSYQPEL
uniref:Electron transfer flavoprotein beta subunit lysine methyltransferase n=1 Tax=Paramormyrops kingsleyae TaxID=1676925 RepID=A0A3B3TF80_9TELE